MKIIRNNKVYVQKEDIAYLDMSDETIPAIVYHTVYGKGTMIVGDFNRRNFEEYSEPHVVEFFKKLTWIVDYDEVKDLTDEDIDLMIEEIIDQRNSIASMYNNMTEEEREKNSSMRSQCELLDYKAASIREYKKSRKEETTSHLPEELVPKKPKEKRVKQFVKTLYDKFKK